MISIEEGIQLSGLKSDVVQDFSLKSSFDALVCFMFYLGYGWIGHFFIIF